MDMRSLIKPENKNTGKGVKENETDLTKEFKKELVLHQLKKLINNKLNVLSDYKINRINASKVELYACFFRVGEIGKYESK